MAENDNNNLSTDIRDSSYEDLILRIHQEKEQLGAILSSMSEGLVVTDINRRIILINQAAGILLRLAPDEAVGRNFGEVFQLYRKDQLIKREDSPLERAIENKNIISISLLEHFYLKNQNGRTLPVAMQVAPLLLNGEVTGGIILLRDITREQEVDQAKSEFVSLASHQLRTPLSSISWFIEMILDGDVGPVNKRQQEYLDVLYQSNQRLIELVNDLLDVSRIDLGTFIIDPKLTDLPTIAEEALVDLTSKIKIKNITVNKKYSESLPKVSVDPRLTHVIFSNLLSNAVKYTPEGGTVNLSIEPTDQEVVITVTDTGYGIPLADQPKIFTKLFRADNIKERDLEGTGLGLYIIKSILNHAGGRVWFDSLPDHGSTFRVAIPLAGMTQKEGTKILGFTNNSERKNR
ncbi:MAG: ATP-binding protein [Candidatus Paceibacterota bacterium]